MPERDIVDELAARAVLFEEIERGLNHVSPPPAERENSVLLRAAAAEIKTLRAMAEPPAPA